MVLLLALSARYPVTLRETLQGLRSLVRREESSARRLAEVLRELIEDRAPEMNPRTVARLQEIVGDNALVPDGVSLSGFDADRLRLVRSFSFVGEPTNDDALDGDSEAP